jgi:hypothetical protein
MSWICSLGSALLGNKVWYLLLLASQPPSLLLLSGTNDQIPGFGLYKLFNLVRPLLGMFLPSLSGPKRAQDPAAAAGQPEEKTESRKQAKLRARMEKGDKRVQQVQRK